MATPNITPDKRTGIGTWTEAQFYGVIHEGIGPGYRLIYPTMPFPSYTRIPRSDVDAVRAYLMSLPPAHAPRLPVTLRFPFDYRLTLLGWRLLYFRAGEYRRDCVQIRAMEPRRLPRRGARALRRVPFSAQTRSAASSPTGAWPVASSTASSHPTSRRTRAGASAAGATTRSWTSWTTGSMPGGWSSHR